jgi:hypothetical protein
VECAKAVYRKELTAQLTVKASSWIAARYWGPETVHAHTSPVEVYVNLEAPFQSAAAQELIELIRAFERSHRSAEAVSVLDADNNKLESIVREGSRPRPAGVNAPVSDGSGADDLDSGGDAASRKRGRFHRGEVVALPVASRTRSSPPKQRPRNSDQRRWSFCPTRHPTRTVFVRWVSKTGGRSRMRRS